MDVVSHADFREGLSPEDWCCQMRLLFSPKEMVDSIGRINQEYFRPVIVSSNGPSKARRFGPEEKSGLIAGLEKYGVGNWKDIQQEFLKDWSEFEIRLRTARALGTQSIASYIGWKGSAEAIEAEYLKNRDIGLRLGRWKGGVLVRDEFGVVDQIMDGRLSIEEGVVHYKAAQSGTSVVANRSNVDDNEGCGSAGSDSHSRTTSPSNQPGIDAAPTQSAKKLTAVQGMESIPVKHVDNTQKLAIKQQAEPKGMARQKPKASESSEKKPEGKIKNRKKKKQHSDEDATASDESDFEEVFEDSPENKRLNQKLQESLLQSSSPRSSKTPRKKAQNPKKQKKQVGPILCREILQ
eukprot:TRINITY_DN8437_c0_g1_i2.p1 TRINITY_DN8437_c0_g1~~TRINITY_DN8437_c0_g1_i2.p1  ORF type:complete len:351 (+),score=82.58 TRINITY_DN8437_c0_g1_i2:55-1107(+)